MRLQLKSFVMEEGYTGVFMLGYRLLDRNREVFSNWFEIYRLVVE